MSIGAEVSENLTGVWAEDAVESDGRCIGLVKCDRFVCTNRETVPINRQILALLGNGGSRACLCYRTGSRTDLAVRRGGEQQWGEKCVAY